MKNVIVLIDSGPLIALFNPRDSYHNPVIKFMESFRGNLITTWPVITETVHLLSFSIQAQLNFLEWIYRGAIHIENLNTSDIEYMKERMNKYSDLPMDLADASLMCIAERKRIQNIISIDSDFSVYRTLKGKYLKNIMSGQLE